MAVDPCCCSSSARIDPPSHSRAERAGPGDLPPRPLGVLASLALCFGGLDASL